MIKLIFTVQREVFRITIENKEIFYSDRRWKRAIRLVPKDNDFIRKVLLSRNAIPQQIINLFELTEEEQKEYDDANTDEELAEIIIKDSRKKGASLLKRENGNI